MGRNISTRGKFCGHHFVGRNLIGEVEVKRLEDQLAFLVKLIHLVCTRNRYRSSDERQYIDSVVVGIGMWVIEIKQRPEGRSNHTFLSITGRHILVARGVGR